VTCISLVSLTHRTAINSIYIEGVTWCHIFIEFSRLFVYSWCFVIVWQYFTFTWPCIVTNFSIIKPTRCTNFPNLLRHETLHVSGSSSAYHQEFIHCTLGTGICHTGLYRRQLSSRNKMILLESCLQTCMTYTSAECTVNKLLMIGRGTARNM